MNIRLLKNIMKEVNEPNEFELFQEPIFHPFYWIYKIENVRLRKPSARFDVFINGLFISENDYVFEMVGNDFYIKFIKNRFPEFDRFGNLYQLDESDEVKIKGDVEEFRVMI
jgi:hypothetical protein